MKSTIHTVAVRLILFIFIYWLLISPVNGLNQWQVIKKKGYLTWITRPSPLTYYTSLDGVIGLEFDILKQFCDSNNINLVVLNAESNSDLFLKFDGYNIDIAGAHLTLTQKRIEKYLASESYDETYVSVVNSYNTPKINSFEELKSLKGAVLKNSSYEVSAQKLISQYGAKIETEDSKSLYELLQMVVNGEVDYTLADSNIISIFSAYIPQLRKGKKFSGFDQLVFYTRSDNDSSLLEKLNPFIDGYKVQNKVGLYKSFIIKTLPNSKPADTVNFLKNYRNRWPFVKSLIYTIAEKNKINPILLGAISYQESHWNPKAVSPTLVKGLMMFTKAVAEEFAVTDRFDPLQSLEAGAKYFLKMKKKIPNRIADPDGTNFALAAYNLGYGHLEKARIMTQKAGANPDLWNDVKQYLPLLNGLNGAKIDGRTAVRYVENIHVYQNLLQWKEQQ